MLALLSKSWEISLKSWRLAFTSYGVQLLMALPLGMQIWQVMEASIGNSVELEKLSRGFDYSVWMDLIQVHGASISPLLGQLRWIILVYLLVGTFLHAGLIFGIVKERYRWKDFWEGAARYFLPFLKMNLFFWFISLLPVVLLLLPLLLGFNSLIERLSSEKEYFLILFLALLVVVLLFLILFVWMIFSKMVFISGTKSTWQAIKEGARLFYKNMKTVVPFMVLMLLFFWSLTAIYWLLEGWTGMISPALIFLFFILQQGLVLFRHFWRLAFYAGLKEVA